MRWRHTWLGALDGRAGSGCRNLGCSITHSHTRAHTHSPKLKCSRQPSVSLLCHRRTHAEAHAHAHTSAGVAGAPRVFKACTQSGVRVRAGAHVCVSVVLRVCSGCARVRMCMPRLGAFQRSLGCRPASHCTASFRHPSYLRVLSSGFSRTGPRQEKLPPAGRSKRPACAW